MYENLITYIIVLLLYTSGEPLERLSATPGTVPLLALYFLGFALAARLRFALLERAILHGRLSGSAAIRRHERITRQHTLAALVLAAYYLFGLRVQALFLPWALVRAVPTLGALIFVCLFLLHLACIWFFGYPAGRLAGQPTASRAGYMRSQVSMSLPVLLPWLVIAGLADILRLLPFRSLTIFLDSAWGQGLYFAFFLVILAVFGPVLLVKLWACRPLAPGPARAAMEDFCRRAGFAYADILTWPLLEGRAATAAVMGLVGRFRYVLVTRALLGLLDREELESVLAHEIGHVKRKHLLLYLVFLAGFSVFTTVVLVLLPFGLLAAFPAWPWLVWNGPQAGNTGSMIQALVVIVSFIVYFRFIFGYFMRNFERQADLFAFQLAGTPAPLISCFAKIAWVSGRSPDEPSWHHFSISERMEFLKACWENPARIAAHDRKVRASLLAFVLCLVLVSWAGYALHYGQAGKDLSIRLTEKSLLAQAGRSGHPAEAYYLLGTFYYEKKDWAAARSAYLKSLSQGPVIAEAANNLAWLYATCEDTRLRDPAQALFWAQKAVAKDPSPHILDTLAESLYANKRYKEAVEVSERAVALAAREGPEQRESLEKQLARFRRALAT